MDVTVIIPNYQHEHCVKDAVRSIELQTYSCDYRIVHDYPRKGKGFRLNDVMPEIKTEWVSIHDADDISLSNRFEVCSKYFNSYDVIYHDVWAEGKIVKSKPWDRELYKRLSYICASTIIVRTDIAQRVKWLTNTYGQDWIWLNLIAQHTDKFKYISEPLLCYRGNHGFTKKLILKSFRRYFLRRKIRKLCD